MFFWSEVFIGYDIEQYLKTKVILEENGIAVKTKIQGSRERMGRDVSMGGNPFILNSVGNSMSEYKLFVKKDDEEKATMLISKI